MISFSTRHVLPGCLFLFAALAQGAENQLGKAADSLAKSGAPACLKFQLDAQQTVATQNGLLGVAIGNSPSDSNVLAVQWDFSGPSPTAIFLTPSSATENSRFQLYPTVSPAAERVVARIAGNQLEISEQGKPILRYNYNPVEAGDLLTNISKGNLMYARPRSDYIHPLFGLHGEELTRDFAFEHPHHRGIYWAWPEVSYTNTLGDLHALQKVFAHPTGNVKLRSGPVFAQIDAENIWFWEHRDPVAREIATIRAYAAQPGIRIVDLTFQFFAIKENITIARRGTAHYGGLNIRMAASKSQKITPFISPSNATPRRAWSDLSGQFPGAPDISGLSVLQHQQNPEYPGDWIQYPGLAWCQPTFPAAGHRYALQKDKPLVLRFRLVIHGPVTNLSSTLAEAWDAFHCEATPVIQ